MPPATLAVASGDDYASLEKNSRIEFYPAHEIGQHMPTAALYFSGEILTMLAYGDRLIVALAGLAGGSDIVFVSCNSGVAKKEFGAAKESGAECTSSWPTRTTFWLRCIPSPS
ncbi:unnamed protein product [Effrenium voratum]|nr:unnamed protein product [Effrenium voratum]